MPCLSAILYMWYITNPVSVTLKNTLTHTLTQTLSCHCLNTSHTPVCLEDTYSVTTWAHALKSVLPLLMVRNTLSDHEKAAAQQAEISSMMLYKLSFSWSCLHPVTLVLYLLYSHPLRAFVLSLFWFHTHTSARSPFVTPSCLSLSLCGCIIRLSPVVIQLSLIVGTSLCWQEAEQLCSLTS